jgi:hypothetical protein
MNARPTVEELAATASRESGPFEAEALAVARRAEEIASTRAAHGGFPTAHEAASDMLARLKEFDPTPENFAEVAALALFASACSVREKGRKPISREELIARTADMRRRLDRPVDMSLGESIGDLVERCAQTFWDVYSPASPCRRREVSEDMRCLAREGIRAVLVCLAAFGKGEAEKALPSVHELAVCLDQNERPDDEARRNADWALDFIKERVAPVLAAMAERARTWEAAFAEVIEREGALHVALAGVCLPTEPKALIKHMQALRAELATYAVASAAMAEKVRVAEARAAYLSAEERRLTGALTESSVGEAQLRAAFNAERARADAAEAKVARAEAIAIEDIAEAWLAMAVTRIGGANERAANRVHALTRSRIVGELDAPGDGR